MSAEEPIMHLEAFFSEGEDYDIFVMHCGLVLRSDDIFTLRPVGHDFVYLSGIEKVTCAECLSHCNGAEEDSSLEKSAVCGTLEVGHRPTECVA